MNQGVEEAIHAEVVLTETQFRALVGAICHRRIGRTRFWELRDELGITPDDFTENGAQAMAFFAQLRRKRIPVPQAKQRTVQFIRSNNL
jgi:hypothetical protein